MYNIHCIYIHMYIIHLFNRIIIIKFIIIMSYSQYMIYIYILYPCYEV